MPGEKDTNKKFNSLLTPLKNKEYNIISSNPCKTLSELSELPRLITIPGYFITGIQDIYSYAKTIN